jgi:hypothetical protein
MFQLTVAEWAVLRSRIVIPTSSRGGRRLAPPSTRNLPGSTTPVPAEQVAEAILRRAGRPPERSRQA